MLRFAGFCLAVALSMPVRAGAQPAGQPQPLADSPRAEADQQYRQAKEFFDDGDYVAAAVMFDLAQTIYARLERGADGAVDSEVRRWRRAALSNMATSYAQAEMPVDAVDAFKLLRELFAAEFSDAALEEIDDAIKHLSTKVGTVVVRGLPKGADVRLDGRVAPRDVAVRPIRVAAGVHTIEVRAPMYQPFIDEFTIVGARQTRVDVEPEMLTTPARVRIESTAMPAQVAVDGKPVGVAPAEMSLPPGQHHYSVRAEAYRESHGSFELRPGQYTVVRVGMTLKRAPLGFRIEPYFIALFPLQSSTPFGAASSGGGFHVFHDYLRFRNLRIGFALEVNSRVLNRVMAGFVGFWCPDATTWRQGTLSWCPAIVTAGAVGVSSVYEESYEPGAVFKSGNGIARLATGLELRRRAGFLRVNGGLGFENFTRDDNPYRVLWSGTVELVIGLDL